MAAGDLTLFEEWLLTDGKGDVHDYDADTFKLAFITNGVTPAAADATPMWSVGSGVDYDANEVSTAGGYVAGGFTVGNPTYTEAGGVATFNDDGSDISLAQNGSGFTNAYWAILYNDTATNKDAIAFIELGGPVSEQAGAITITWNASGIFTKTIT